MVISSGFGFFAGEPPPLLLVSVPESLWQACKPLSLQNHPECHLVQGVCRPADSVNQGTYTGPMCCSSTDTIDRLASRNVVALGDHFGGPIKQLTQADLSIVLFEMRVHQRLDLTVADICPPHPPIAAATPTCVWWSPLLLINPSGPEGVVALPYIGGKTLSSPKSTLSIVTLPVVATPGLPVSPSG